MASRPLLITIIGALYALLGIVMLALGALTFAGGAVGGEVAAGAVGGGTVAVIGLIYIIIALGFLKGWKLWWYLGVIFAINGAEWIDSLGVPTLALLIFVTLFTAVLNFLMPSHAAKIGFMGPIIVPLFMMLNISPEATYLAYRIGDSITNCITPMMAYFVLILSLAQRYNRKVGMGTMISNLVPYSVFYMITYLVLLVIWYVFDIPLGPGTGFEYIMG